MKFNTENFKSFREDVQQALLALEEKYSVKINPTNIKYNDLSFKLTLECQSTEGGIDVEKTNFIKHCHLFGFVETDYKRHLEIQGKKFELIGFNINKPKNNCSVKSLTNGQIYQTNDKTVKRSFI